MDRIFAGEELGAFRLGLSIAKKFAEQMDAIIERLSDISKKLDTLVTQAIVSDQSSTDRLLDIEASIENISGTLNVLTADLQIIRNWLVELVTENALKNKAAADKPPEGQGTNG